MHGKCSAECKDVRYEDTGGQLWPLWNTPPSAGSGSGSKCDGDGPLSFSGSSLYIQYIYPRISLAQFHPFLN